MIEVDRSQVGVMLTALAETETMPPMWPFDGERYERGKRDLRAYLEEALSSPVAGDPAGPSSAQGAAVERAAGGRLAPDSALVGALTGLEAAQGALCDAVAAGPAGEDWPERVGLLAALAREALRRAMACCWRCGVGGEDECLPECPPLLRDHTGVGYS